MFRNGIYNKSDFSHNTLLRSHKSTRLRTSRQAVTLGYPLPLYRKGDIMPFDGPEFVVTRFAAPQDCMLKQPPGRLSALLDQVGIEPVPDAILDAHKAAE